jgi:hypothetical protein
VATRGSAGGKKAAAGGVQVSVRAGDGVRFFVVLDQTNRLNGTRPMAGDCSKRTRRLLFKRMSSNLLELCFNVSFLEVNVGIFFKLKGLGKG